MRRSLLLAVCLCLLLVSGLLVAAPVAPYGDPAPGLSPRSWACYKTCVLPTDILAADMNTDGWTDIAVLCSATGQVHFLANDAGPGVFGTSTYVPSVGPNRFDNGSQLGLAGDGVFVLYENGGVPAFGQASLGAGAQLAVSPIPTDTVGFVSADFNHIPGVEVVILRGAPSAQDFNSTNYPLPDVPVAAAFGDLNQDAWLDFVVLLRNGQVLPFYNLRYGANPAFAAGTPVTVGIITPTNIDVGDFNADGLLDFVVVGSNPPNRGFGLQDGYAQVFLNNLTSSGVVGFAPTGNPMRTWGFNARAVEVLDADGNGRDDFAVANWGSATVTVFLTDAIRLVQDGRATDPKNDYCLPVDALKEDLIKIGFFLYKLELQCGYYPIALAAADFDFNGKMDLAIALQSSEEQLCAQNPSCIEVIFDVACGFHPAGTGAPVQLPHPQIPNVTGENTSCPVPCKDDCAENEPPAATIEAEEDDSGN